MTKKPKIIVLHGDRRFLAMALRALRTYKVDATLRPFVHGTRALQAARRERPLILITNFAHKGASGLKILEALKKRKEPWPIHVIITTGYTEPVLINKVKKLGAYKVLPMPVNFARLAAAIKPLIVKYRARTFQY